MAEAQAYAFSKDTAIQLRNLLRTEKQSGVGDSRRFENRRVAIALSPGSGVPARSGATPGTAEVTLLQISTSDTLVTTTVLETVYNLSGLTVAPNAYLIINREYISGKWVVAMESCEE